ncbi:MULTISPECIES: hypothetical protein [unclassified Saccharibacter]|uniref:hypothetical protein n=1 Tax=unclassified Saccharibacter TaxID=2648722 RepID=UPI001327C6EC|nr:MULTISPECIES: hypothetical protein [unclassified Saccharibacter]MXV35525.1 hypothetical protein [Saccharibacter sp. EH611]MXV58185.1 hypothetical protein [Saccharibacter sp. EH70]MXV65458.1 hypothetical protein [Saccharibacter sp. EH60]
MQEDPHLTEDSLRQALSRLGAGDGDSPRHGDSRVASPGRPHEPTRGNTAFGRRRRFSGGNHVIVEHAAPGRKAQSRQFFRDNRQGNTATLDEQNDAEQLRRELRAEKRRCRDAEAEAEALKQRLQSFETRLAHYRLQVDEQKKALEGQQEETLRLKAELHHAREREKTVVRRQSQKRQKTQAAAKKMDVVEEQEPVQWWKD